MTTRQTAFQISTQIAARATALCLAAVVTLGLIGSLGALAESEAASAQQLLARAASASVQGA